MLIQKRIFILFTLIILCLNSFAAKSLTTISFDGLGSNENPKYSKENLHKVAQMKAFAPMTIGEYKIARGKKLNFIERVAFHASQHRIKHLLKKHDYGDDFTFLQKLSWFLRGFVFGPIAVLLGYLLLKDEDRGLIKWIWLGFAALIVMVLIIALVTIV